MRRLSSFFVCVVAVVLLLCSTSAALPPVQVRVRMIEASNVGSHVDPTLRELHRDLGALFNFTSYRILRDVNLNLQGNRPVELIVHPGRSMEVTLIGDSRRLVELRIRLKREGIPILNTNVRLTAGRVVLIGGPRHGEGTMILAVSTRFQ